MDVIVTTKLQKDTKYPSVWESEGPMVDGKGRVKQVDSTNMKGDNETMGSRTYTLCMIIILPMLPNPSMDHVSEVHSSEFNMEGVGTLYNLMILTKSNNQSRLKG